MEASAAVTTTMTMMVPLQENVGGEVDNTKFYEVL